MIPRSPIIYISPKFKNKQNCIPSCDIFVRVKIVLKKLCSIWKKTMMLFYKSKDKQTSLEQLMVNYGEFCVLIDLDGGVIYDDTLN